MNTQIFPKVGNMYNRTILLPQRQQIPHEDFCCYTGLDRLSAAIRKYIRKVREWERIRIAGKAATNPANETAGTNRQSTDKTKDSTRRAI